MINPALYLQLLLLAKLRNGHVANAKGPSAPHQPHHRRRHVPPRNRRNDSRTKSIPLHLKLQRILLHGNALSVHVKLAYAKLGKTHPHLKIPTSNQLSYQRLLLRSNLFLLMSSQMPLDLLRVARTGSLHPVMTLVRWI
jgi:hypothetical protein